MAKDRLTIQSDYNRLIMDLIITINLERHPESVEADPAVVKEHRVSRNG